MTRINEDVNTKQTHQITAANAVSFMKKWVDPVLDADWSIQCCSCAKLNNIITAMMQNTCSQ